MAESIRPGHIPDMSESPLNFRRGKKYNHEETTPELKYWLCREYDSRQSEYRSAGSFGASVGFPRTTFYSWWSKYERNRADARYMFAQYTGGRFALLDEEGADCLENEIHERKRSGNAMKRSEFAPFIYECVKDTARRRGKSDLQVSVSPRTQINIKNGLGASFYSPQRKTHARDFAESDLRNVITMAVMCKVFCGDLLADMIFNWDATQYEIDHSKKELVIAIKTENDDCTPISIVGAATTSFFVKHYHLHNAAGVIATPVYVIAVDQLDEEDSIQTFIPNLGYNGGGAWLCFTKTRCGNPSFYRWFVHTVLLQFVEDIRKGGPYLDTDNSIMRAFICCDGEAKQIEIFQEKEVLDALTAHSVDLGKLPASCSGILQASDVSPAFRSTKKYLKSIAEKNYENNSVRDRLSNFLNSKNYFTADKRRIIVEALLQISSAVKNSITPNAVMAGYRICGQYPVDWKKTLRQSKYEFTSNDEKIILDSFPKLEEEMSTKGQISETFMDNLNIPKTNRTPHTTVPNDQRPLHQQRCVIMNNEECIKQWKMRQERKLAKLLAETTGQRKKRAKNRPKEVILAEKAAKAARMLAASANSNDNQNVGEKRKRSK